MDIGVRRDTGIGYDGPGPGACSVRTARRIRTCSITKEKKKLVNGLVKFVKKKTRREAARIEITLG